MMGTGDRRRRENVKGKKQQQGITTGQDQGKRTDRDSLMKFVVDIQDLSLPLSVRIV